jgi:hypothetical protein
MIFSACDKEKQVTKKMIGEWELVQFKITLQDGTSQFPASTGKLIIVDSEDIQHQLKYNSQLDYTLFGNATEEIKTGFIVLRDKGNYLDATVLNESNTEIASEDHRIMVLTKTDLQLEYSDLEGRLRNLTYRKK